MAFEPVSIPDAFADLRKRHGDADPGTPEGIARMEQVTGELGILEEELGQAIEHEAQVAINGFLRYGQINGPLIGALSACFIAGARWEAGKRG